MCGFYLNELLLRLLPRDDPHEALFEVYGEALRQLSAGHPAGLGAAQLREAPARASSGMLRCSSARR